MPCDCDSFSIFSSPILRVRVNNMYDDNLLMYEDNPYMHDDKPDMYDDLTDMYDDMTDMYEYHIHVWYHIPWGDL